MRSKIVKNIALVTFLVIYLAIGPISIGCCHPHSEDEHCKNDTNCHCNENQNQNDDNCHSCYMNKSIAAVDQRQISSRLSQRNDLYQNQEAFIFSSFFNTNSRLSLFEDKSAFLSKPTYIENNVLLC
ncbi:MAG: hypothetical protein ACLFSQ_02640 [Candidatus Zixiibacteriota bacterium]